MKLSRRARLGVAALAVALGGAGVIAATGREPEVSIERITVDGVPEPGGAANSVPLETRVYRLTGASGRSPAVLLAHGFGGSAASMDDDARRLARAGYVVLTWTARGFGSSGGLLHLNDPDYEVADARRMVDLLAQRDDVVQDGAGDPRLAAVGASYGGGLTLSLGAADRRVDTLVPQFTWNDLRRSLLPNAVLRPPAGAPSGVYPAAAEPGLAQVLPAAGQGVFKKAWAAVFFGPGASAMPGETSAPSSAASLPAPSATQPSSTQPSARQPSATQPAAAPLSATACGRVSADLCQGYLTAAGTGTVDAAMLSRLGRANPDVSAITAPTMLIQGQNDSLFPLAEAQASANVLSRKGTEVSLNWVRGGHDGGMDGSERVRTLTLDWLDRHLRTATGSGDGEAFQVSVPGSAVSTQSSNPASTVRGADREPGLPGAAAITTTKITMTGTEQQVLAPAGGWPAAVSVLPGLGSLNAGAGSVDALANPPGQVASFQSEPLDREISLTGSGTVKLRVTSPDGNATLFVSLQDVAPDGSVTLPAGLVSPIRLTGLPAGGGEVEVALPAVVRDLQPGDRVRVSVSTTDQAYSLPNRPAEYRISLADNSVELPTPQLAVIAAGGPIRYLPWALGLLAVVLAWIGTGRYLAVRRRRVASVVPADQEQALPLRITGLAKVYDNGYQAVREVSFDVERGWVLGLLGPNGAGKTTVLRMVLGLIAPSAGEITVFGERIGPGAPVLTEVGALVEGPGFLPHVSGRRNLELYWASTGRPIAQARMDEALAVARLGTDIERQVRTYSMGMRQRLAIAQAMLGMPDLLILDEPTNGLDPPQIQQMREVMSDYARTGRTVVVSSHLLAEVEQTCTHVVVMDAGRVAAAGRVDDLVGSATLLTVDVDDPPRAAAVATAVPGASSVEVVAGGLTLELVGTPRAELVRALVDAGIGVDRVTPRRGLEQAFLALVGDPSGEAR